MSARSLSVVLAVVLFLAAGVAEAHTLSLGKADAAIERAIKHKIVNATDVQAYACVRITAHRVRCKLDFAEPLGAGTQQCTGKGVAYYASKRTHKVSVKLSYGNCRATQ